MKKYQYCIIGACCVFALCAFGSTDTSSGAGMAQDAQTLSNQRLLKGKYKHARAAQNTVCAEKPCCSDGGNRACAFGLSAACDAINGANADMRAATGIGFFYDYYAVYAGNVHGGLAGGSNYTGEMIFGLDFDFEKIAGIKGLSFVISGAYASGANLSNRIGNFFTVSESFVSESAAFYEMYLSQKFDLFDGYVLKINLGRMSMASAFMNLPAFGYLVSGGMDNVPEAVFSNSPFTSSPTATWGVNVSVDMPQNLQATVGIYQVPLDINSSNYSGTKFSISSDDAYMALCQLQWSPEIACGSGSLSGIYQVGAYYYGGYPQQKFNGGVRQNAYGFYVQGQQQIWRDCTDPNRSISLWCGAQFAPVESLCVMPFMAYGGLQFQGIIPCRPLDSFLVSWTGGWFSGDYAESLGATRSCENVVELTYVITLTSNISIQPDIQYIIRPYGNPDIEDALVLAGQLIISF